MHNFKTLEARIDRMADLAGQKKAMQESQPPTVIFRIPIKDDEPRIASSRREGNTLIELYVPELENGYNELESAAGTPYPAE